MVERPADVLPMDRQASPVLAWYARTDAALRRTRGLGIFVVVGLLLYFWRSESLFLGILLSLLAAASLLEEFAEEIAGVIVAIPGSRWFFTKFFDLEAFVRIHGEK
jgi:hypothetical protein